MCRQATIEFARQLSPMTSLGCNLLRLAKTGTNLRTERCWNILLVCPGCLRLNQETQNLRAINLASKGVIFSAVWVHIILLVTKVHRQGSVRNKVLMRTVQPKVKYMAQKVGYHRVVSASHRNTRVQMTLISLNFQYSTAFMFEEQQENCPLFVVHFLGDNITYVLDLMREIASKN